MICNKALFRRWAKFLRTDIQSETGWPVEFVILMQHQRGDGGYKDKFTSHNMFSGAWTFSSLLWPLHFILQWPSITAVLWTSHTALNLFILLSCFQVVHVFSCLHNQIESSWTGDQGPCFILLLWLSQYLIVCWVHRRPINPSKVEPNWISSLGNLDSGPGRIHKIYWSSLAATSHFISMPK